MSTPESGARTVRIIGGSLLVGGNVAALFTDGIIKTVCLGAGSLGAVILLAMVVVGAVQARRARPAPAPAAKKVRSELYRHAGKRSIALAAFQLLGPVLVGASLAPFLILFPALRVPFWAIPVAVGPTAILAMILAASVLIGLRRLPNGTRGKLRLTTLAWGTLLQWIGLSVGAVVVSGTLADSAALAAAGFEIMPSSSPAIGEALPIVADAFLQTMGAHGTLLFLVIGVVLMEIGARLSNVGLIATWFLVPAGVRDAVWFAIDVVLVALFVGVTLLLPLKPGEGESPLLPSIRLAVTTVAATRMLFVILGPILDLVELGGFRMRVAARLIRAKRSGFLTVIGGFSILAVAVSSCMLTSVLSVMGGFRNDLKQKILANNAHVVVDVERGTFEDWEPTLATVRAQPNVVAATPYVHGEVMITSATNLSGAILRGIDPATIGEVTELRRNLTHGRLEYLEHPEQLLRLDDAEMRRDLLETYPPDPDMLIDGEGSFFGDVESMLLELDEQQAADDAARDGELADGELADGELTDDAVSRALDGGPAPARDEEEGNPRDPETVRIEQEIESFLLPDAPFADPDAPEGAPPGAEVLPGLIVGQELARTLRLHVGDQVNVVSPLGGGLMLSGYVPKSRPFRVAGIFYSGMYEFDMKMAYTTLDAGQAFLSLGEGISGIEVKVDDTEHADTIAAAVSTAIHRDELRVRGWQEVNQNLFRALQLEKLVMFITLGIAILVAGFCIVGTLLLLVQEKAREVGILKAMGASGEQIVAVFMIQGLMIGLLGAAIGLGFGYETCFIMEHYGIHLNPEVYYIDRLPVHIDGAEFAMTGITAVIVCLLATIYPAILGSRLRPVDALRFN